MRVGRMVRELVGNCSGVVHLARLAATIKVVEGIVQGGKLSPATVGRNLPGSARPKHGIKCVDRLLGSSGLWRDRLFFFLAIAHRLLDGCHRPIILIDWTEAGGKHEALVAAVPIGGRALPIYVEVHPAKKLGNVAIEGQFLCSLRAILPSECRPIVVTDAGFRGPFLAELHHLKWDFVGRVRGTATARGADGVSTSKDQFYARASTTPTDLGTFRLFAEDHRIPCRLVLVRKRRKPGPKRVYAKGNEELQHRKSAQDPWLLATSLTDGDAAFVTSIYARRMQIEETFRDAKNHRFGWSLGLVRLSSPLRTAALLLLATLALVVVTLLGMGAERQTAHRAYQANTRHKRVLSFFVLACAILRREDARYLSIAAFRASLRSIGGLACA